MRTTQFLLVAGILAACSCSRTSPGRAPFLGRLDRTQLDHLIGQEWPGDSVPIAGAQQRAGWMAWMPADSTPRYGLQLLVLRGRLLVTAQREIGRRGNHALWRTSDAAWLPTPPDGYSFATTCSLRSEVDTRLFALARVTDTQWYTDIRAAWRLNVASGRIEVVGVEGVRCENEGYGTS